MLGIQALADADTRRLLDRVHDVPADVASRAKAIVEDVRTDGDVALRRWTKELDGCDLADPWLSQDAWDEGAARVPAEIRGAIDANLARVRAFHRASQADAIEFDTAPGLHLGRMPIPLGRAACYVPGGRAAYPSTVIMTVAPAAIAGVHDIIVVTPPQADGTVAPAVCYAAKVAGAHRILRAGGAQAVAAVAFGTDLVPRADVLVGPGNAYVTAAKQRVAGALRTDFPAGPSELLVIADATANPRHVALDLAAQAEHDPDAQVVLVATSNDVAQAVAKELDAIVPAMPRAAIAAASLRDHGAILVASLDDALGFADAYAPEHLSLAVANPRAALARVQNAGSVFLGTTPVSLGDYGSGTNHVLPTMGYARLYGGLSVDHFVRWMTWQDADAVGLDAVAQDIVALARAEGLDGHADAVLGRIA